MNTVYRDYTQQALDTQYRPRDSVADFAAHLEDWQAASQAARSRHHWTHDLAFGPHPRERLDLCHSGGDAPVPAVLFIHGGFWHMLDKSYFSFVADDLAAAGHAVAIVQYPLCPEATIGDIVESIDRAVRMLRTDSDALGLDPTRLAVTGHSAGGHLAAMLALSAVVRGGGLRISVPISGLFDLEPLRHSYLNQILDIEADQAPAWSPTRMVEAGGHPVAPLHCLVGGAESDEFRRQQADFVRTLEANGHAATGQELEGHDHFSVLRSALSRHGVAYQALQRALQP